MFKLPRGTRDFTTEDMQKRRYVEEVMRSTFKTFGYQEIQTPTFETLELFTAKSGETIEEELYSFTDKGDRDLALRPELTAPVIRFYVDKLQMNPKPLKLFYFGSCYRYDRPQKGRYREFWQIGCELIGTATPEAIAELIALAYFAIKKTGLKNIKIKIGHVSSLMENIKNIEKELPQDSSKFYPGGSAILRMIDKEDIEGVKNAFSTSGATEEQVNNFIAFLDIDNDDDLEKTLLDEQEQQRYRKIISLLINFDIPESQIKRDMKIARGLDYYNGIVFEIEASNLGAEKQICGGGEYSLIPLFGGKETPTAGFAIGFDRTIIALESEKYQYPKSGLDVFIIPVNEDMIEKSIELAQSLRDTGISVDLDLLRRGMSKSLKYASSLNAKKVIIVGPKELEQDSIMIRDMNSGKQNLLKIKDLFKINLKSSF